jgi:hypothetical protein
MFTTKAGLLGLLGLSPTLAGLTFRAVTGQLNGSGSASVAAASGKSIIVAVAYGNASPVAVAQASLPAWAILTGDASDDYVLYLLEVPVTNPDIE